MVLQVSDARHMQPLRCQCAYLRAYFEAQLYPFPTTWINPDMQHVIGLELLVLRPYQRGFFGQNLAVKVISVEGTLIDSKPQTSFLSPRNRSQQNRSFHAF